MSHSDPKDININISCFSPNKVLAECDDLAKYQLQAKGLELKIKVDIGVLDIIESDKDRYRRIILNLLLNSIKYTYKGEINISLTRSQPNFVFTTITDTGLGMSKEALANLFKLNISDKHIRDNANPQGIGLGLTMCWKIASALGGGIEVESELGVGSKFTFWIKDNSANNQQTPLSLTELPSRITTEIMPHVILVETESDSSAISCNCKQSLDCR